jgi:hypothetical protein
VSIETTPRKALAVFLLVSVTLVGAAVLDEVSYHQQDSKFREAIEAKFTEQSLKVGAWVLDRKCVAAHIGLDVTTLPSYKLSDGRTLEAATGRIKCSQ